MKKISRYYYIGVDGGATRTIAVLGDEKGKILRRGEGGSSSLRNVGIKKAIENIKLAILPLLKNFQGEILSTFLGLPAFEEEYKNQVKAIKKELLKHKEISPIFKGKVIIGSDQLVAFRAGTDEKEGIVQIAGTGCVAHGWRKNKEVKVSGWGWLTDEGSAFWTGQKCLSAIFKDLDGRGKKTLLTPLIFKSLKIKTKEELLKLIYSQNPPEIVPYFSILVEKSAKKGDKVAQEILKEASQQLILTAKTAIKKLNFQKKKFPLVLVGSMFNSKLILNNFKKEIKKFAPQVEFFQPKKEEVVKGALKLAKEMANSKTLPS
jgi:N-acetylglucosamine kinase-like BadF-type ATPase